MALLCISLVLLVGGLNGCGSVGRTEEDISGTTGRKGLERGVRVRVRDGMGNGKEGGGRG